MIASSCFPLDLTHAVPAARLFAWSVALSEVFLAQDLSTREAILAVKPRVSYMEVFERHLSRNTGK